MGFHAFQLSHSGFFHFLEIPWKWPLRGKIMNAGSKTKKRVQLHDLKDFAKNPPWYQADYQTSSKSNAFLRTFW